MVSSVSISTPASLLPSNGAGGPNRSGNAQGARLPGQAPGSDAARDGELEPEPSTGAEENAGAAASGEAESPDGLTAEERAVVAELQQIDRQGRAHEQAHLAAAGGLARGVSFSFTTGPDGQQYAVGGEVSLDTSPVSGDPRATIQKAQQIRAAASAPANPSGQDRAVAAQASAMEQAARQELAEQQQELLREQVGQQNRESQAQSFEQPDTSSRVGALLSLIA
jgi:hypothetical protein